MNAAMRINRFSGAVLLARDGQPIVSRGYGMANIEHGVPNTPQTVFRLGSVTKQFTAMAVVMLQERGKLSVNDPICKYLADCPPAWQPITIKNLLTHTAGIPNYTEFPDFVKTAAVDTTPAELTSRFRDKPLQFALGEKYAYSNSGYYLLGTIIERASGKAYADFLQENIFAPLGMKAYGIRQSRPYHQSPRGGLRAHERRFHQRRADFHVNRICRGRTLFNSRRFALVGPGALHGKTRLSQIARRSIHAVQK